ncbi:MAG TPA: hypothetical protein VHN13_14845, partial [Candidatus Tectomicrobia bacterium]|nr:hypothetical protein [Candidatus Tectomicrobia bacterium]
MLNRALKAVLLLLVVSGLVSPIVSVSPGGTKAPPGSIGLSLGTIAQAQDPGAPLRYRVVAEQSEARYRIREQLAGFTLFRHHAVPKRRPWVLGLRNRS